MGGGGGERGEAARGLEGGRGVLTMYSPSQALQHQSTGTV